MDDLKTYIYVLFTVYFLVGAFITWIAYRCYSCQSRERSHWGIELMGLVVVAVAWPIFMTNTLQRIKRSNNER